MFDSRLVGFSPFSFHHLIAVVVLIAVAMTLFMCRRQISPAIDRWIRMTAVVLMLGMEWTFYVWSIRTVGFDATLLPCGLCAMSLYLTCVLLLTRRRRVFAIVFPWAITGAIMSYGVADVAYRFPHFRYLHYFGNHGLFLLGCLYMQWVWRFQLTYRDVLQSSFVLTVWAAIMFPLNYLIDANHLFLRALPDEIAPLFAPFGVLWPLAFSLFIFVVFNLVYATLLVVRQTTPEADHETG